MGWTHFSKVSGVNGVGVGAKGSEVEIADSSGNLSHGGTAVSATATELNIMDGVTATTAEINTGCDGILAAAAEINTVCDGVLTGSGTVDVASIAADANGTLTITVTGAALGDFAIFSAGVDLAGLIATCYVSAADTVTVNLENQTAGAIDLASTTWKAKVFK